MPNLVTTTLVADGQTPSVSLPGNNTQEGRRVFMSIPSGTFGGGTVQLQVQRVAAGAFLPVTGMTLSAVGQVTGVIFGVAARASVAGSTTPSLATINLDYANTPVFTATRTDA